MAMDQQLLVAARTGNLKLIKELVDAEANILDATTPQGNTALHMAARFGHKDLVYEIMNWRPSLVLSTNLKGETPVHVAAKAGQFDIVQFFKGTVENLASIRDNNGNTPLHCAVRNNHKYVLWLLVDGDQESLGLVNNAGESPLFIAIDLRLTAVADSIIFANPSTLEHTGDSDQTPLHRAVIRRDLAIIDKMLDVKRELIIKQDVRGRNPLHYAVALGDYEMVKKLLEWDISAAYQADNNQQIPLHLAAKNGQANLLKLLLNPCPDTIEVVDNEQRNILHLSAKNGYINVVSYVLDLPEAEDLVNASDVAGNTPLHLAAMNFHSNVAYFLSRNSKVDIRVINLNHETALDVVYSTDDCGMELQKHLTLKTLKSSYTTRAGDLLQDGGFIDMEVERSNKIGQRSREMSTTLLLMATLIATFTFTAAFTIPGGFRNNDPDEGMAALISRSAFKAFVISDSVAFTSSMTAAVLVFWSSSCQVSESLFMDTLPFSIGLTWIALVAMALAFVTGLFVVLSKTLWLAILVCVIGCSSPAILYLFAPLFLLVFDRLSSSPTSLARRRNILEDNPFLFIFRLSKMIYRN
ncbi:protein ACCELERATED CELL DEATH 6-like [Durio zibethinus]|uniref:Protein ACCELERATED CELL DEATH 6-like n=1 Tax=Durio zibethinus TaxID=66656 RepID=A0A6P5ZNM8_DURZI|nr:protein ACCELERATED CELL DEATH 6-like [Durio zibethinus]